jgi:cytochrome c-type biogenesis protein CcmH
VLAVTAAVARAARGGEADADRTAHEIAQALRCPVCQNVSVADSPSAPAEQMRDLIRKKIAAGETRDQIVAYFVDRYGEDVLLVPPREGIFHALWGGPAAFAAAGAAVVAGTLRRWTRAARRQPPSRAPVPERPLHGAVQSATAGDRP